MSLWFKTDETEEAISALEMLAEIVPSIIEDTYRWKWVIIITHNALQGFMVLALRHGNGLLALKDDIAAHWLKAYREGGKYPVEKLDSFLNLYKKIKSDRMLCYVHSKKFTATLDHERAVKKLNQLRNEFSHFVPKGWHLELTGLPEIILRCLEVIEFLVWKSGNIMWYKEDQQRRAVSALKKARDVIAYINQNYEKTVNKVNATDS